MQRADLQTPYEWTCNMFYYSRSPIAKTLIDPKINKAHPWLIRSRVIRIPFQSPMLNAFWPQNQWSTSLTHGEQVYEVSWWITESVMVWKQFSSTSAKWPRSAKKIDLEVGLGQGQDMVPSERSCHKEHTCHVSKLYL